MKLREDFVVRALESGANVSELCREFGISRKTAYKWVQRFKERGLDGLADMSRRPHGSPLQASAEAVVEVIRLRRERPRWGPKKLHAVLLRRGLQGVPSVRTIARILDRAGEVKRRRTRPVNATAIDRPSVTVEACNDVWTVDFKGWWKSGDGSRCEPLTVRDAFSRFVLCMQLLPSAKTHYVRAAFERLFEQHGLPKSLQMDNGSPFANVRARAGLTKLSAWWVSVGIRLVRSRPGHPQDNGAHERMHLDVRFDVEDSSAETAQLQQAQCDQWRHEFNHVRPHEALGQRVPADIYRPSLRRYRGPARVLYPPHCEQRKVNKEGHITYRGQQLFVGRGLGGYDIALEQLSENKRKIWFYDLDLGELELRNEEVA